MRRPQSERVVSLAASGARSAEDEEAEVDEEEEVDGEVAIGFEANCALRLSRGLLLSIVLSIAERAGDAITGLRGLRARAEAAAARGAGKDI